MKYRSSEHCVTTSSRLFRKDAEEVVELGRAFLACLGKDGAELDPAAMERFEAFIKALYSAGFVMTDFNGPLFARGPLLYLFDRDLGPRVAASANLITIRMFLHSLVRGHRATDCGIGFPYFDEAWASGGLAALIERLSRLCERAREADMMELDDLEGP